MQNTHLAKDYISRAEKRIAALKALFKEEAWADVVRESQEVVELALKGLIRSYNIEVPRVHDVSDLLLKEKSRFPKALQNSIAQLAKISKTLRRDRELAFYGTEDLTPQDFYSVEDATSAMDQAVFTVKTVKEYT